MGWRLSIQQEAADIPVPENTRERETVRFGLLLNGLFSNNPPSLLSYVYAFLNAINPSDGWTTVRGS
jgi:hypothetical protein